MTVKQIIFLKSLFILVFLVSSSITSLTFASSEQAWKKHDQEIKTACIKASKLKDVKTLSNVMLFDDRFEYSAILIQGKHSQAHMKNKIGRELCIWNKTIRKAYLSEVNMKLN
ncbi:MAG: hypothetical protein ACK4PM_14290 [Acinetobacter junii]